MIIQELQRRIIKKEEPYYHEENKHSEKAWKIPLRAK